MTELAVQYRGGAADRPHVFAPIGPVKLNDNVASVPYEWRRWAAVNLIDGHPVQQLIDQMVANGFDESLAYSMCTDLAGHPAVEAGRWTTDRLRTLESVLDMRQQLRSMTTVGSDIEARSELSGEEFLDDYYSANLPVKLTDLTRGWEAIGKWSPRYLASVIGAEPVEVMTGRDSDARFEINSA